MRQPQGLIVKNHQIFCRRQIADMNDKRVESRPALGCENLCDGVIIARVTAKAVDSFSWKCDQCARSQKGCGLRQPVGVWR